MKENIARLFAAMELEKTAERSTNALLTLIEKSLVGSGTAGVTPPFYTKMMDVAQKEMLKRLPEAMAEFYSEHFTDEEIEQITIFQLSSAGKKLTDKLPLLQQVSAKLGEEVMMYLVTFFNQELHDWQLNN